MVKKCEESGLLDPEDGGTTIIRNIGKYLRVDMTTSQAILPMLHHTSVWPCSQKPAHAQVFPADSGSCM